MASPSFTTSHPAVPRDTPAAIAPAPIPTPTHGAGGSFTVISSIHIDAPPDVAFTALLDHASWPEWNRFVRRVTVTSSPPPPPPSSSSASEPPLPADASALETAIARDDGTKYLKKGMCMTFNVHLMDPEKEGSSHTQQGMEVTLLEPFDAPAQDTSSSSSRPSPHGRGATRKGWRIAWKGTTVPSLLLRTERVQEVVDDGTGTAGGGGGTEYTCWETMYGPLAPVVRLATGKRLETGFRCWAEDLKRRAEKMAAEGGAVAAQGALATTRGGSE